MEGERCRVPTYWTQPAPPQRDQAFVLGLGWMGASPEGGRSPLDCKSRPWSAIRQGEGDIEIDE
jgi:hypothetical protein